VRSIARLVVAALLAVGTSCSRPLPNAHPSDDGLASEVLAALEQRDAARLQQLALNEDEFRDVVWPELPAARPERNLTADYVWRDLHAKSRVGLEALIAEYGGKPLQLVRVEYQGETTQHRSFLVRRDAVVIARNGDGQEQRLRLFGSVVERAGRFKIFSYNVD
jgi:hypothetical protein